MRLRLIALAMLAVTPVWAGGSAKVQYFPAKDLAALPGELREALEKAPKDQVPYNQGLSPRHLIDVQEDANHYMDVIHRVKSGLAEWHDVKTDLYVVVAGEGRVVVGGNMPGKKEMSTRPGEWRASSIAGGEKFTLTKGDMINIPSQTPHQVLVDPGKSITYLIIKIIDKEK